MTQQWYRTETVINKGTTKEVHLPLSPQKETHNVCYGFFCTQNPQARLSGYWVQKNRTTSQEVVGFYVCSGFPQGMHDRRE